jgi:hypothetical protein
LRQLKPHNKKVDEKMNPNFSDVGRFQDQGTATVDANGRAEVTLTPHAADWEIDYVRVSITPPAGLTQVLEATAIVYYGLESATNSQDSTLAASSGDQSDTKHYLADGQALLIVWTGADVGGTAVAVIRGWKSLPGRGFRAVR